MEGLVFNDATSLIKHLNDLSANKNYVFRGYSKQNEVFPSLIRYKNWKEKEIDLLSNFERYALPYFSANSPIDFMSYAQHYGLPTRLLDFTYNPFIALFFSLYSPKGLNYKNNEDKTFYYLRCCDLTKQNFFRVLPFYCDDDVFQSSSFATQCRIMIQALNRVINGLYETVDKMGIGEQVIVKYFKKIYSETYPAIKNIDVGEFKNFINIAMDNFDSNKMLLIDANQCSQRIVMQQGLFMFPYKLDVPTHKQIIDNNTTLIKVHKSLRKELLEYLNKIGINSFRLMPDMQSICEAVKRRVMEE